MAQVQAQAAPWVPTVNDLRVRVNAHHLIAQHTHPPPGQALLHLPRGGTLRQSVPLPHAFHLTHTSLTYPSLAALPCRPRIPRPPVDAPLRLHARRPRIVPPPVDKVRAAGPRARAQRPQVPAVRRRVPPGEREPAPAARARRRERAARRGGEGRDGRGRRVCGGQRWCE